MGQGWLWAIVSREPQINLLPHSNLEFIYIVNFGTQAIGWPLCYILLPTRCPISGTPGAQAWSNKFTEGHAPIRRISNQNLMGADHVTCFGKWKERKPQLLVAYLNETPWSLCYSRWFSHIEQMEEQGEIIRSWENGRYWRLSGSQTVGMVAKTISLLFSKLREKNEYYFLAWWSLGSLDLLSTCSVVSISSFIHLLVYQFISLSSY